MAEMMFDRHVTVDWSASSRPQSRKDSIWICVLDASDGPFTVNPKTRSGAEVFLRDLLLEAVASGRRTLVGCDFPYGYPAGFATALQLGEPAWLSVWNYLAEHVRDGIDNNNNRFDVASEMNGRLSRHAFWGRPLSQHFAHLSARRDNARYRIAPDAVGLNEWRIVERLLRLRGQQPHSAWKLVGAGSVGSQSLTGIPVWRGSGATPNCESSPSSGRSKLSYPICRKPVRASSSPRCGRASSTSRSHPVR